jgi:hypothetical protein
LHKSAHSGLTLDEMLVPLIVVNSNKIKRWWLYGKRNRIFKKVL